MLMNSDVLRPLKTICLRNPSVYSCIICLIWNGNWNSFFLINWFLFLYCSSNFKLSNTILVNGKHPAPIVGAWVVTGQNNNFAKCWVDVDTITFNCKTGPSNVLNTSLWFKYANLGLPPATSGLGNGPCMENQDCYMYMYIYGQRQSSALAQCQGSILVKQIAVQWDNIGPTHYNRKPFIKPTICQHFRLNKDHWAKLC